MPRFASDPETHALKSRASYAKNPKRVTRSGEDGGNRDLPSLIAHLARRNSHHFLVFAGVDRDGYRGVLIALFSRCS